MDRDISSDDISSMSSKRKGKNSATSSLIRYNSGLFIWVSAISLALSIFQSGYQITVIGTLQSQMTVNFGWDDNEAGNNISLITYVENK